MNTSQLRLQIVEYSDKLINELDFKAETLLLAEESDIKQKKINEKRSLFIDEIKRAESTNLYHLNDSSQKGRLVEQDESYRKFCILVDQSDMDLTNEELELDSVDAAFGFILILDKYLSQDRLTLYRSLLRFNKTPCPIQADNPFFKLKYQNKDANMTIRYSIFENKRFIIDLNQDELFKLNEIELNDIILDSVRPEAVFLFQNIKRIKIYSYLTDYSRLGDVIRTARMFEQLAKEKIDFLSIKIVTFHHNTVDLIAFNELVYLKELIVNSNKITFE